MRNLLFAGMAAVILAAPAALSPAMAQATGPTDTGNMAYPQPRATGQLNRQAPTGRDVGSAAYPRTNRPGQTTGTTNAPLTPDTGNMAYPQPRATGVLPPTRTQ